VFTLTEARPFAVVCAYVVSNAAFLVFFCSGGDACWMNRIDHGSAQQGILQPLVTTSNIFLITLLLGVSLSVAASTLNVATTSSVASPPVAFLGASPPVRHLCVLVHGFVGTPQDLTYLKTAIERHGGSKMLVHLAQCNLGKTHDGVVAGGSRLAEEVGHQW